MGRLEKKIKQTKLKQQMQEIFVSGCGGKIHGHGLQVIMFLYFVIHGQCQCTICYHTKFVRITEMVANMFL